MVNDLINRTSRFTKARGVSAGFNFKIQGPTPLTTEKELDGGFLIEINTGPRKDILKIERDLVETNPGPLNKEPWAGKRSGQ